jgi:cytochrome c5
MSKFLHALGFTGSITMAIAAAIALPIGHVGIRTSAAAEAAPTGSPLTLKSVNIDLPTSDRSFPDGPGADAINNNCLVCHSAGMVLNQPAMSETAWSDEVHKMVKVYKAPVSDQDAATIIAYLTKLKGIGSPPP